MKKGLVLAFSLLLLCVAGCSNLKNVPIDAYVWKITVIQEKTKIQEESKRRRDCHALLNSSRPTKAQQRLI